MTADQIAYSIEEWNKDAFEWVNSGLSNVVFDIVMPIVRQPVVWVPLYIFFAAFFYFNFKKQTIYILLFAGVTIFISDQLSAHVLKFIFQHPRPCSDFTMAGRVRMLVDCGPGFSFPSTHATNHFALAFFLISVIGKKIKWLTPALIFWAALISIAQVYVGLHFPLDVICGGVLGSLIGYWMGYFCKKSVFPNENAEI